ncbi:MAG: YbaB/EbfC family nucleoid-associated protein [Acidobacteria bacterium]|nr:YbaB/EbfC family nucleoid-associated protein [Acidobacteriota bacterium]
MIDFNDLMQKAQMFQGKMKDDLEKMRVQGSAGGEMVKVVVNGNRELTSIQINPEALKDPEMLEDMILSALQSAYSQVNEKVQDQMSGMLGGLDFSQIGKMFGA